MSFFLASVLPYLAVALFCGGLIWRIARWRRAPVPYPLTLAPPQSGRAAAIVRELITFRALWQGDRRLWFWAWLMHAALALVIVGHFFGIGALGRQFTWLGLSAATSKALSAQLGIAAGAVLVLGLTALAIRRAVDPQVRRLSAAEDYIALVLLFAIAATGMAMRLGPWPVDLAEVRAYLVGLALFQPQLLPSQPLAVVHLTLAAVLLAYLPFSKLVHFAGAVVGQMLLTQLAPRYPTPRPRDAA